MTLDRRQTIVAVIVLASLSAAVIVLWVLQRRASDERSTPVWTDPQQPPDNVATAASMVPGSAQSWAANRALPMAASCGSNSAGRRTRRVYADTLANDPNSLVRAGFTIGFGGC